MLFIRRIAEVEDGGDRTDLTADVLAAAEASTGTPVPLRFNQTFRQSSSLAVAVTDEAGAAIPSIGLIAGVVSAGLVFEDGMTLPDPTDGLFVGAGGKSLVLITSAHTEIAPINVDMNDLAEIDLGFVPGIEEGDTLEIEIVMA